MTGQFRLRRLALRTDKQGMRSALAATLLVLLAGCEMLGIPDPAKEAAAKEAEGKAIGSACRQSARRNAVRKRVAPADMRCAPSRTATP